jgi:hypothetical protein
MSFLRPTLAAALFWIALTPRVVADEVGRTVPGEPPAPAVAAQPNSASPRLTIDLSGPGWKLWHDRDAAWKDDELFLPPVDLAKLPVRPPTGGWSALDQVPAIAAAVPGTAEEYLQQKPGPAGDILGVTWWWRDVVAPAAPGPRRLVLRFESARQRTEVYVDGRLVGYDLIGNTPFAVDLTDHVAPGGKFRLAVRITDPGGNFDWRDGATIRWGKYQLAGSHGFGGITGRVRLEQTEPVHVADVYLQNQPAITTALARITLENPGPAVAVRDLTLRVYERGAPLREVFRTTRRALTLDPGVNEFALPITAPGAKPWSPNSPALYVCEIELHDGDRVADVRRDTFGFRWFEPAGIGQDATFRLNGQRIFLRSAISWGFFPINGIYATPEIAERQVRTAKAMGLNMLHFHRAIGQPHILALADELGLLYYAEPGNYRSGDGDPFAAAMARVKLLRMVKRDRNHPSLVIYNMINEDGEASPPNLARRERDLRATHQLDPSRSVTRTSAWAKSGIHVEDPIKMHMRPFDPQVYLSGWYDFHHAGGPAVWMQSLYRSPTEFYNRTTNREEIVFWGEEGAISTPPRLDLIKAELAHAPRLGWDGQMYLDWHREFTDFLARKGLQQAFPTVDRFTTALGAVSLGHQGRKIELSRLNDVDDGYTINGWEAMIIENHSGVVDCFRFPKADPAIVAHYNQPFYVAVKPRDQIVETGGEVLADFYALNELDRRGPHTLVVRVRDAAGNAGAEQKFPVELAGGDTFGQLLAAAVRLKLAPGLGYHRVETELVDAQGQIAARGHDPLLAVDSRTARVSPRGAAWGDRAVTDFLRARGLAAADYTDNAGPLDWVAVSRAPGMTSPSLVPTDVLRAPDGQTPGLQVTFHDRNAAGKAFTTRADATVNLAVTDGATPDPAVPLIANYGAVWEGQLVPPATGTYTLGVYASGATKLFIDGKVVVEGAGSSSGRWANAKLELQAGRAVALRLEFAQRRGDGHCRLLWSPPDPAPVDVERLLARVRDDGTTLLLVDFADTWMELVAKHTGVRYAGSFKVGSAWAGGQHFVRAHPLFAGLPVDDVMDWPYQALVRNGNERSGLLLEGEELVAGAWHAHLENAPQRLGTAVGVIPYGKGRIVFSTLALTENLNSPEAPARVAQRLFLNFLEAGSPR